MTERKIPIVFEADTSRFERAVEEQFKPALRKAVSDVIAEFFDATDARNLIKMEIGE